MLFSSSFSSIIFIVLLYLNRFSFDLWFLSLSYFSISLIFLSTSYSYIGSKISVNYSINILLWDLSFNPLIMPFWVYFFWAIFPRFISILEINPFSGILFGISEYNLNLKRILQLNLFLLNNVWLHFLYKISN